MYLVVGKHNCSRCDMVKNLLNGKGIPYEYKYLEDCTNEEREYYMNMARENKQLAMPLILNDNVLVKIQEV